ncbi:diguanylate cyclase [Hahella sp. HN01]|uniref:GGDEF domain-containing protein n=1 Tax=Hahella sp. HN01 TaxID=2847262 RepID=UPI001C1F1DDE|nr:GGDEF domain-containing protein [Hahella sp. HN01]MBU6952941.1 GGDEF domain-containing protein [Hahella sp. HN01]
MAELALQAPFSPLTADISRHKQYASSIYRREHSMSNLTTERMSADNKVVALATSNDSLTLRLEHVAGTMLRKLQTTLEVEELLQIFVGEASALVAIDGYSHVYNNRTCGARKRGTPHQLNYRLTLAEEALGEITFYRGERFTDSDIHIIETLLGSLVYPLRNGLRYQEAMNAALSDSLTGVANKRAFDYQLHREVSLATRYKYKLSMLFFDIDYFKKVNDTYGHAAGDALLQQLAKVVQDNCRDSDLCFRFGGEEFAMLLAKTESEGAYAIAERLREAVANTTFQHEGHDISFTISIGVATYDGVENRNDFLERADQALYDAKHAGRNRTKIAPQDQEETLTQAAN